jgi:hypothetical protein
MLPPGFNRLNFQKNKRLILVWQAFNRLNWSLAGKVMVGVSVVFARKLSTPPTACNI